MIYINESDFNRYLVLETRIRDKAEKMADRYATYFPEVYGTNGTLYYFDYIDLDYLIMEKSIGCGDCSVSFPTKLLTINSEGEFQEFIVKKRKEFELKKIQYEKEMLLEKDKYIKAKENAEKVRYLELKAKFEPDKGQVL